MSKDEKIKAQQAVIEYLKGELQIMTAKYNTMADAFHNLIMIKCSNLLGGKQTFHCSFCALYLVVRQIPERRIHMMSVTYQCYYRNLQQTTQLAERLRKNRCRTTE